MCPCENLINGALCRIEMVIGSGLMSRGRDSPCTLYPLSFFTCWNWTMRRGLESGVLDYTSVCNNRKSHSYQHTGVVTHIVRKILCFLCFTGTRRYSEETRSRESGTDADISRLFSIWITYHLFSVTQRRCTTGLHIHDMGKVRAVQSTRKLQNYRLTWTHNKGVGVTLSRSVFSNLQTLAHDSRFNLVMEVIAICRLTSWYLTAYIQRVFTWNSPHHTSPTVHSLSYIATSRTTWKHWQQTNCWIRNENKAN